MAERFRITVAYDGRSYDGWQSQPEGNTIQDALLRALREICPEIPTVQGSGRTDAGVSALGQVAHFDPPGSWKMQSDQWQKALNTNLPPTIRILSCSAVDAEFHARFSATGKVYQYRICTGTVLPPLEYGIAWHRRGVCREELEAALHLFVGSHHFRAFSANRNDGKDEGRDTRRTIFSIQTRQESPQMIAVDFHGDGFLYKMVRFLIGSGVYLAQGKLQRSQVESWLAEPPERQKAPYCAPADGLLLKEVCYD